MNAVKWLTCLACSLLMSIGGRAQAQYDLIPIAKGTGEFNYVNGSAINNRGVVAFTARKSDGSGYGVYRSDGNTRSTVASGFTHFLFAGPKSINDAGCVVFGDAGFVPRIWSGDGSGVQIVAESASSHYRLINPRIMNNGTIYYERYDLQTNYVDLFRWRGGVSEHIANHFITWSGANQFLDANTRGEVIYQSADTYGYFTGPQFSFNGVSGTFFSPLDYGGLFSEVADLSLNDAGSYAFIPYELLEIAPGEGILTTRQVIRKDPEGSTLIATASGDTEFFGSWVSLNNRGDVAYTRNGWLGGYIEALYVGNGTETRLVARTGDVVGGMTIQGFAFIGINDRGEVAFTAYDYASNRIVVKAIPK